MKKIFICTLCFLMACSLFAGGSKAKATSSEGGLTGSLTVTTNATDPTYSAVKAVIDKFAEENPGLDIEYITYGSDYENLMKAKMAANDLPDVFATHGWGVKRYAEYLMPLNNLSFVDRFTDTILGVITTPDGDIVTMPVTSEMTGICYNKDILKAAGWDRIPRTFKEFLQSCRDIREKVGVDPVLICGKDTRGMAQVMDIIAPAMLCSYEKQNYQQELYDGTFDWSLWKDVVGFVKYLVDEGLTNKDVNTADPLFAAERLANGEACYFFYNQTYITDAWSYNPDVNLSMMWVPVHYDDDEPIMIGGERESYGIWKDTKNPEAAIALLEFMARPENIKLIGEACGMPNPFGVDVDLRLSKDLEAYNNLRTLPYFDREWLPSGMWATMRATGGAITAGEMTVEEACKEMEKNYLSLLSQQ